MNRVLESNKYDYGHALIIAGSAGMLGSSVLCARACLRAGAGLVSCAVPEGLAHIAMAHFVEVMVISVPTKKKEYFDESSFVFLENLLKNKKFDAIGFGCGIGREKATIKGKNKFLKNIKIPIVIDADGLFELTEFPENCIITPHEKEMSRLLNADKKIKNRAKDCQNFAKKNNLICLLKGNKTVISDGHEIYENTTGNPGMATAGTGDVLTGIITGLLAQNKNENSLFEIAKAGAFIHGKAGDLAKAKFGESAMIASDVIEELKVVSG